MDAGAFASRQGPETLVNSVGMKFVRIEAGSFMMGQSEGGEWDERPVREVTISKPFWMSATEVTNAQYEKFDPQHSKLRGKLRFSEEDDEAVVFVSWNEAAEFCKWLSKKEGKSYRLPTEAEWEYACRAGTTTPYNTGDDLPEIYHKNQAVVWYPNAPIPLKVGATPANPWGLYDMHGNVEEWCSDWYGPYEENDKLDPVGRSCGDFKVTRGGSHSTWIVYLRSANRLGTLPDDKSWLIGFRLVLGDMPETKAPDPPAPPLNQQNVSSKIPPDLDKGPHPEKPFFMGPIEYIKIPPDSNGPMYSRHNHDPALVDCPNGDLLAIWYSCRKEATRELTVLASRLRYGSQQWELASVFWNGPDRNDHAPALWFDGKDTIYHFNGLSAAATWGNLALIMRTSTDSGATWSKAQLIAPEHGFRHQPVESVIRTQEGIIILPCDAARGGSGGTAVHISRDGGRTWTDPGAGQPRPRFRPGETGAWIAGIHAGVVQLKDGSLMALGRGNDIDGRMPMSISKDMGKTWSYSPTELPAIAGGQRLVLRRLMEGPLLLASFTDKKRHHDGMLIQDAAGKQRRVYGLYTALSFDEGKTWPVRKLVTAGNIKKEMGSTDNTVKFIMDETNAERKGYLASTQTPNGIIHLISSRHYYAFNLAWLKQPMPAEKEQ